MKYRIIKTVECPGRLCLNTHTVGHRYGISDFLDINAAHNRLERLLLDCRYTCGCQAGIIEVKD